MKIQVRKTNLGPLVGPIALCFAVAVPACGEDEETVPPTELLEQLDSHISELEETDLAHGMDIAAVSSLADVTALENGYLEDMEHHSEELDHTLMELGECSHDSEEPDMSGMHDKAGTLAAEAEGHVATMGTVPDLEAAQAEEQRHADAMTSMFMAIRQEADLLSSKMSDHMCAAHHDDEPHDGEGDGHHD